MTSTPSRSQQSTMNEKFLERLFYKPGSKHMEDGRYQAAAALFQQAYHEAKGAGMSKSTLNLYQRLYSLAIEKQKNQPTVAQAAGGSGSGPANKEDAQTDPVPEVLLKDGKCVRTFDDVIGLEREKEDIINNFMVGLEYPKAIKSQSRMLLYGPPGTGKSYIIKALACEMRSRLGIDVQLFVASGAEVKGKYVGETEKNIKHLFEFAYDAAKANGRSILFMDEFDAIGGTRESGDANMVSSVNAMLQILEGAGKNYGEKVIFIAATNFPWRLDAAILRRFQTKILLDTAGWTAVYNMIRVRIETDTKWRETTDGNALGDMVEEMANSLAWSKDGYAAFLTAMKKREVDEERVRRFLQDYDHRVHEHAAFPIGASTSDVNNIATLTFNRIGMRVLKTIDPVLKCYPLVPDTCTDGQCVQCVLSKEQKHGISLYADDLLKYTDEFDAALQTFGSNVKLEDYADLVAYKLTGYTPTNQQ